MKKEKYPGIMPDDDGDIQVIEDLTAWQSGEPHGGGLWHEAKSLLRDIFFAGVIAIMIVVFVVQPVRVDPVVVGQEQLHPVRVRAVA